MEGHSQCFGQKRQDSPGVFGGIQAGRAKVADQQLFATEYIEWEKTVVPIISVKELSLLIAMNRIVGGIEIQRQLGWLLQKGVHEAV